MALESPLMASPTPSTPFSPFDSPTSPSLYQPLPGPSPQRNSANSDTLAPPPSPYPAYVDPSPVDSNGTASTDATDIDDDTEDESQEKRPLSPLREKEEEYRHEEPFTSQEDEPLVIAQPLEETATSTDTISPVSKQQPGAIDTAYAGRIRADSDSAPLSVIHAPQDFGQFSPQSPDGTFRSSVLPSPTANTVRSDNTVISPTSPKSAEPRESPAALNTDVPLAKHTAPDRATPRAQTRQEVEDEERKRKNKRSVNLEDIPEAQDSENTEDKSTVRDEEESTAGEVDAETDKLEQIEALKTALSECWTLCNTLAGLSTSHRTRVFNNRGKQAIQEHAWRTCWKLCQNLYDSREEDHTDHVLPTLEMCKEFCLALFEARQRGDELADSVLRVSFELNNHLYNTHDRMLPVAFQERTLDFYLTLCHRLMKQRTSLPQETDALLRACWSLAEMLFSIRQNNREGKPADEELLGSAVQACWELCDLFREGWTQVRPDRGTPRPSQTTFSQNAYTNHSPYSENEASPQISRASSRASLRSLSSMPKQAPPPETPTTIFDDTNEESIEFMNESNVPNILVLGPDNTNLGTHHNRWSSSASTLSSSSQSDKSSNRSKTPEPSKFSSASSRHNPSDTNLHRIRILLVKAAFNAGFQPRSPPIGSSSSASSKTSGQAAAHREQQSASLVNFVKTLPSNTFGPHPWQATTLEKYRKLVLQWPSASRIAGGTVGPPLLGNTPRRVSAAEVARAVQFMMKNSQYTWLRDLFRVVFGCFPDDGVGLTGTIIQA